MKNVIKKNIIKKFIKHNRWQAIIFIVVLSLCFKPVSVLGEEIISTKNVDDIDISAENEENIGLLVENAENEDILAKIIDDIDISTENVDGIDISVENVNDTDILDKNVNDIDTSVENTEGEDTTVENACNAVISVQNVEATDNAEITSGEDSASDTVEEMIDSDSALADINNNLDIDTALAANDCEEIFEEFIYINPVYKDIISEEDLLTVDDFADDLLQASDTVYYSIDDVVKELKKGMMNRESNIVIQYDSKLSGKEVGSAVQLIEMAREHSGVGNEGDYIRWGFGGGVGGMIQMGTLTTYRFGFTNYTTAEQERAVTEKLSQVYKELSLSNKSDYMKIHDIYKYLCDNISYDYANLNDKTYKLKYTAYAALINKTAVCEGYAVLLYRMLLDNGIDSRVITSESHGWNIAKLDGLYYDLDSTWDAGRTSYSYFLKCEDNFVDSASHVRGEEYTTEDFNLKYPMAQSDYSNKLITITSQPQDIYYTTEKNATLSVRAEGNNLSYQWYVFKDDTWYTKRNGTDCDCTIATSDYVNCQFKCKITDSFGNVKYTDTVSVIQGEYKNKIIIDSVSLSDDGIIGLNIYMTSDGQIRNEDSLYVKVNENTYPLKELTRKDGFYVLTIKTPAKSINDKYNVTVCGKSGSKQGLYNSEGVELKNDTYTCSVGEYCEYIRSLSVAEVMENLGISDEEFSKLYSYCFTLENYGNYAQDYFGYNTENISLNMILDLDDLSLDNYSKKYSQSDKVNYKGSSLLLKSAIMIRHYFEINNCASPKFYFNGKDITGSVKKDGNSGYYVELSNIPIAELDKTHSIEIKDGNNSIFNMTYCGASYFYDIQQKDNNVKLKNLCSALLNCMDMAKRYFAK